MRRALDGAIDAYEFLGFGEMAVGVALVAVVLAAGSFFPRRNRLARRDP